MKDFRGRFPPRHRKRTRAHDEGFTLIELLVVMLIIGILLAIAIPTFLSTTKNASDTAAQANLETALTSAKAYYTNAGQSYSGLLDPTPNGPSTISQITAGTLTYYSGSGSTGVNTVSVSMGGNAAKDALEMTAWAKSSRTCWIVVDITDAQPTPLLGATAPGTYYAVDPNVTASACVAGTDASFTTWPSSVVAQAGGFPAA